ncbi:efflux RND transporter periplasmic adaptor subunit [bacterium]|nr:MAG: efflux RND transporter periplasmic adaptor subunit [bacterium]
MKTIYSILLSSLMLAACSKQVDTTEQAVSNHENVITISKQQFENAKIETEKPEIRALSDQLHVMGSIDLPPDHRLSISVPLAGNISWLDLLPGSIIKKGQPLVRLRHSNYSELQENYLTVKSKLELAQVEFKRIQQLYNDKAVSEKSYYQAKADLDQLGASFAGIRQKLSLLGIKEEGISADNLNAEITLYSPINGYVSDVFATQGEFIQPDRSILELINPDDIHLNINIQESDIGKISEGLELTATSNAYPDSTYFGHILLVGKNLDEQRMIDVHAHFENKHIELIPGLFMNVTIETNKTKALSLPSESVVQFGAAQYVFKQTTPLQFEAIKVETGKTDHEFIEILSSFDSKDNIVTKGAYTLLMQWKNISEEE